MEIYPALDLYEGKVVRLERGDYSKSKVYSHSPLDVARKWADQGARWIHVVDLEGAREGSIKNWNALDQILSEKRLKIQFGGGVRKVQDIEQLQRSGVKRVILGTKGLDTDFLTNLTSARREGLAVSLDLRGDEIQVEGWLRETGKNVYDAFQELAKYPFECAIVTDISRDGTLSGIDAPKIERLLKKSPFPLILSGGFSSTEDIGAIISLNLPRLIGVIIGKALYEGRIDLGEAIRLSQTA